MPRRPFLALTLAAMAAACSSPEDMANETGLTKSAGADDAMASATSAEGRSVEEDTELYQFAYAYPGEAARIPALAGWLESRLAVMKAGLGREAEEGQADAETGSYPYQPHSFSQEWKVIADLPGYLSLSGEFATYSGGAHGNYGMESFVWDKRAGKRLETMALFRSPAALNAALGDKLCDALNRARAERRGEPVPSNSDSEFDRCVGVEEATLLVGSSNGRTFDRLGVWFGPYVAGSYAEGGFELNFPVDAAVLRAVRPAHRAALGVRR